MAIANHPMDELPREKARKMGIDSLSDSELLAIILRTGTKGKTVLELAREMILKAGGLNQLSSKSDGFFKNEFVGIGADKAITLSALFEIAKRVQTTEKDYLSGKISSPDLIAEHFIRYLKNEPVEKFMVAFISTSGRIIKIEELFRGTIDYSLVDVREIIKRTLDHNAKSIIISHNHPSGSTDISPEDRRITKKIKEACNLFDIKLLDHILIAGTKYVSFSNLGVLNLD
jgi:DNA repair protein RadC